MQKDAAGQKVHAHQIQSENSERTVHTVHPVQAKALQKRSREASQLRGTSGRAEHKGKARSTNKPYGGKMAK